MKVKNSNSPEEKVTTKRERKMKAKEKFNPFKRKRKRKVRKEESLGSIYCTKESGQKIGAKSGDKKQRTASTKIDREKKSRLEKCAARGIEPMTCLSSVFPRA
jgi:hypothetical protein